MRRAGIVSHLALTILLIACSSQSSPTNHQFRLFEENGIQIAETTGGPKYVSELFQYEVELVIPPGSTEESVLELPRQFYSDTDGYLYIFDEFKSAVLVYQPDGHYSHTIGREGFGPGDLQHPRIQDVRNGIVTLFDLNIRRLSLFSFDGALQQTFSAPVVQGVQALNWNTRAYCILSDGSQILLFRHQDTRRFGERERVSALFLSSTGDTLAELGTSWIETGYSASTSVSSGGARSTATIGRGYPYGPQPTCTYNSQVGIVIGNGVDPILTIYDFDAAIQREIRIIEAPLLVDATMRQRVIQKVEDQAQSSDGYFREFWQDYHKNLQFPNIVPFSADVEVEDNGYIWIKVPEYPTAVAEHDDSTWRLMSPEGEYLGMTDRPEDDMRNPPGSWRKVFHGRLLIMHEEEETGEWLPTVYRIRPISRGLNYPN